MSVLTPRHVVLLLYGSRGDVQPGICLGAELRRRGYRVTAAVPPNLADFARSAGLDAVVSIGRDTARQWSSEEALDAQRSRNPLRRIMFAIDTVRDGIAAFDDALVSALVCDEPSIRGVDLLIAAPLCQARGLALAERLGVPLAVVRYAPMSESGVIGPLPGITDQLSAAGKRRSWRAYDRVVWWATRHSENGFRRRIGLRAVRTPCADRLTVLQVPQIQAYDPAIASELAAEWARGPAIKPIVGFFELSDEIRAALGELTDGDTELTRWLAAGEPPVFVGFGSMPVADPLATRDIIVDAARRVGLRCVVALGGAPQGVVDEVGSDVYHVGAVNHSWLLPRCAAAVHHGGAGTTAATLRAGIPTVIYSFTAEQPFWAGRVAALGVGVGRRFSALTPQLAFDDLTVALSPRVRTNAARLATTMITSDDALRAAADVVESQLSSPAGRYPAGLS